MAWRGGREKNRDGFVERMREGAGGGRGRGSGKNPCALLRCTYWSPTDEASPRDWRRVVGRRATSEAPLPCRLGPLLDDHPETRLMGPVGAPEIPTRTGHNARLKVGSTTDGKAPTDATTFKQGRTVTSPDLLPALPFSLLFPCPSIASLLHASSYLSLIHSSSSSADPQQSWLPSRPPSSACSCPHSLRARCPHQQTESCTGPQAPCASGLHCMRRHSADLKK